ncbi:MAG: hypothetical protein IPK08_19715 [Bacteroidetes bacterium]|nr:hypothetical protein [Bacteroidota bacterium]
MEFAKPAMELMLNYHYPGNIRELENTIAKLHVFTDGQVRVSDLPDRITVKDVENPLRIEYVESEHIKYVLRLKKGNQAQTQLAIGYGSINTLKNKLSDYDIHPDDYAQ